MNDSTYTHKNLTEVEDKAAGFGIGDVQEARFPYDDLDCEQVGFGHHVVKPGKRQAFGHKHEAAEEVYIVIGGTGRVKLDDDVVDLKRLDAIRVAPQVTRQFEAGSDGLELLVFGQRHKGDGEVVNDWWSD
jgi:mannose-6-phosphate isomerase-like protein (cupin superfamily)